MNKTLLFVAVSAVSAGASAASSGNYALEEVIVTAQKTEETVQSVPISIQALDARALQNNAINSLYDINSLVPSLKFTPYPTADQNLLVTLRGIAPSALELTQDTPTAVHINGVYIARGNGLNMAVADLERIEVLRGPQGTLYGRNATAGAINMITAKPSNQFSFTQQLTVAQRNEVLTKTSVNIPVTDDLFVKLAYLYNDKDGFVKNSAPQGIDFGERNAQAARFDVRWQPSDNITVDYGYDWGHQRYYTTPEQCLKGNPDAPLFGAALDMNQCSSSFLGHLAYYEHSPKNSVTVEGHTLGVEWDLSAVTLRSITAYRTLDDKYYGITLVGGQDLASGTFDVNLPGMQLPAAPDHTRQHQFSQEFQVFGELGEQLSYTAGLYYFREGGSEKQERSSAVQATFPAFTLVADSGPRDLSGLVNESKAVFMQFTWTPPVLDGDLDIIPGIRYTQDSRKASLYQKTNSIYMVMSPGLVLPLSAGLQTGAPGNPAEFDRDFSKTTPSLTVQYHFNADVMGYAKYAKGYKSGGTAVRASSTEAFESGFAPETLDTLELGVKSAWLNQRLRVNADVFQSKFKDQQVSVRNVAAAEAGVSNVPYDIVSAGSSTYQGGELELQAALTENLRISANYAYLHFQYDKVEAGSSDIEVTDFYHNVVPTNSYAVSADYTRALGNIGTLAINVNYSHVDPTGAYQDKYDLVNGRAVLGEAASKKVYVTPSYGVWNGRVAVSDIQVGPGESGNLTVALWGKNLENKKYISFQTAGVLAAAVQGFWGEPRTVGLDLIYRYE